MNLWISVISATTALLAVVIGPLVALKVAKLQTTTPIKREWSNTLRQLLAEFLSCSYRLHCSVDKEDQDWKEGEQELDERMDHLFAEMSLLLDPDDPLQAQLLDDIEKMDGLALGDYNFKKLADLSAEYHNAILTSGRKVLNTKVGRLV